MKYTHTRNKDGVFIDRHALFAYLPLQLKSFFFTENVTSLIFRYAVPSSYITNKTERRDETDTTAVCLASTLNYYDAQLSSR